MSAAPLVSFYADDFTGASDNLAQFHRHGLKSILFFEPPSRERLAQVLERGPRDVVGVAGVARALPTEAMAAEIDPALESLAALGAPLFQYKCCSTFDSSPAIGSLGEAGRRMALRWPGRAMAVLAAMPEFGRYTVFGNHFARCDGAVYRLDRHPVMSRHPSTPMHEADLRRVLAAQGLPVAQIASVDRIDAAEDPRGLAGAIDWSRGPVLFDSGTNAQLVRAAGAIWQRACGAQGVLAIASQGIAHGLGQYLREAGLVRGEAPSHSLAPVERLLVLSGSCSPTTAAQIEHARRAGWHVEGCDPIAMLEARAGNPRGRSPEAFDAGAIAARLSQAMDRRGAAVVYTARGPDDPSLARVRAHLQEHSIPAEQVAAAIGNGYARIVHEVLARGPLRRIVVCGGDSSSYAMRALGAWALEVVASSFADNAHVCRLLADDPAVDGMEVLLKGGQVGRENVLLQVRAGF